MDIFSNVFICESFKHKGFSTRILKPLFKKYKAIVAKPINGFSGNNVILFKTFNANKIKKLIKNYNHLFFQKFLPGVSKGDKRVFIKLIEKSFSETFLTADGSLIILTFLEIWLSKNVV